MIARDATPSDVLHVLTHLRAHNAREFAACRWSAEPEALAQETASLEPICIKHYALCAGPSRTALDDGPGAAGGAEEPAVALIGAWLIAPGVAVVRLCATEQWLTIARPAYRWLKRVFIPCVLEPNVRRAETRVLDTGAPSREWLHRLGFHDEGIARALGRNGEDFVHVAWINPSEIPR